MVTYNRDVPDAPNNPSVDQPKMKENTNSTDTILAVDHISFNATNGGTHLQTSFEHFSTPALIGFTDSSVAFPAPGEIDITRAQYYFRNSLMTSPLSFCKAIMVFSGIAAAGAVAPNWEFNVTSVVQTSVGQSNFTITLDANTLNTTKRAAIFITPANNPAGSSIAYTVSGQVITLTTTGFGGGGTFSILVAQI